MYASSEVMAKEVIISGQELLFTNQISQAFIEASDNFVLDDAQSDSPVTDDTVKNEKNAEIREVRTSEEDNKNSDIISKDDPVDLTADQVEYDEVAGIVSAIGKVELVQSGRILRADKISYDLTKDKVEANGNVVLNELTGDTYFADSVELTDKMKDGFVTGLSGALADGSRFTAEEAEKIADLKLIMRHGSYTACEPCKADPSKAPLWAIKAEKVTHHKDEQRVSYKDATFEVAGVPVAYTPYFSHPDGSVKRKSGFLTPSVGFDSYLGAYYQQDYYWDIAPDKDATIGTMVMTDEAPLVLGEYRQRFKDAEIKVNSGTTYSSRIDRSANQDVFLNEKGRGHFFAEGLWDINDKWRAGTAIQVVSDDQYLRQYNLLSEDVLENKIYAERFSGRDYATGRLIRFKDIRISDRAEDQPNVLPEVYSRFLGDPNSLLGGRWSLEASALGLRREGDEQDMSRGGLIAGWQGRHTSNLGLVNTLDLTARADIYNTTDRNFATAGRSDDASALRGFAQGHYQTSLPFEKGFKNAQMVVEPLAAITVGTNVTQDDGDIPNEDSQDVFLDMTNIFNPSRFPGNDRLEDSSHATYGFRTGLYADNGYQGEVFLGQSYRFDKNDNPFPGGSGLSEQESDFVGNLSARLGERLQVNYSLQLANDTLASRRHEADVIGVIGPVSLGTKYFYTKALDGTNLETSREQIKNSARYQFSEDWAVFGSTQYDLAQETEGLRRLSYGLDYEGQCVTFLISGERTLTRDSTGDSGTEIMMRLGLKNLGEFQTSGVTLGTNN